MKWGISLGLALVLMTAAPAVASADTTYCVPDAMIVGCPAGATGKATVTDAMAAVNGDATTAHDVIRIGPGLYTQGALTDQPNHRVDIIGEGESQTSLTEPSPGPDVLTVEEPTSTISDLSVDVPAGSVGIDSFGDVDAVTTTGTSGIGIEGPEHANLAHVHSTMSSGTGVVLDFGTLSDSAVIGRTGFQGAGTVVRSSITGNVAVQEFNLGSQTLTVDDSLIIGSAGPSASAGVQTRVGQLDPQAATVILRHDTILGDGSSGSVGVGCSANVFSGGSQATCATSIDSTIIRGFAHALDRAAVTMDSSADATAKIVVDYTDLDPSSDEDGPNTSDPPATSTGAIELSPSTDLNVDPRFAGTGTRPYALTRPSPLIDAGDPVLGSSPAESATDLAGAPRQVAGRSGGPAVSDIGAYEYQPSAPGITITAPTGASPVHTPVALSAHTTEADPSDVPLSVTWNFGDGARATGSLVSHAFAAPGAHTVSATVTDVGGFTASTTATVFVGTVCACPAIIPRPVLRTLRITPSTFKIGHAATISYRDSLPARTTFTVLRPASGVRSGRRCIAPPRHRTGHPRRCTRYVSVESFAHSDVRGVNRVRFTGRVRRRSLTAGSYRLQAVARNGPKASTALTVKFGIKRS